MPYIAYIEKNFHESTQTVIDQANEIIEEYAADGFDLTLRQLYYQFVARDLIPNKQKEYSRLGRIINDARMAGLIDWNVIEDRTRSRRGMRHFDDPKDLIEFSVATYHIDYWINQQFYIEVWIEKDALTGVISRVCNRNDVSFFSCRGYVSQSEMWRAARRLGEKKFLDDKEPIVLHLGDHDPSGIDMTRDISERLNHLAVEPQYRDFDWEAEPDYAKKEHFPITVRRIALNMDQIEELSPPPNPAKVSDSRFDSYLKKYGHQSWELDALDPKYIERTIQENIDDFKNEDQWEKDEERYNSDKQNLWEIRDNYSDIIKYLEDKNGEE